MLHTWEKENLNKLSKEQLIKIIEDYAHKEFLISCVLVDESKWHIESDEAIRKIRDYLNKGPDYTFYDEHLSEYVDLQLGKLSGKEYRKIVLNIQDGEEDDEEGNDE